MSKVISIHDTQDYKDLEEYKVGGSFGIIKIGDFEQVFAFKVKEDFNFDDLGQVRNIIEGTFKELGNQLAEQYQIYYEEIKK